MSGAGQGARKRSENRQKQERLTMRLSPAERQEVETLADRAGLTLASYLRSRALEQPTTRAVRRPVVERVLLTKLVAQLGRVGNNLNQIARGINLGQRFTQQEIQAALAEHRQILAAVIEATGRQSR